MPRMAGDNISESARERETFRHDPTLLTDIIYNDTGELAPNLRLSATADPILTALAQLGACRTGASRAFISLFDQAHQYFIAETTQTSSLRPDVGDDDEPPPEPFWFRGTAIPRGSGICQRFLNKTKPVDENGTGADLPVNLIPDIHTDPLVIEDSCVLLKSPSRGYIGVPIRSQNGVDFGEYSLVTEEPIRVDEWSDTDSKLLQEISQSILDHLLSKAAQIERKRAEKQTRGIGAFVEQRSTPMGSQHGPPRDTDDEMSTNKNTNGVGHSDARRNEDDNSGFTWQRPNLDSIIGSPSQPLLAAELRHPTNGNPTNGNPSSSNPTNGTSTNGKRRVVDTGPKDKARRRGSDTAEKDPLTVVFSRAAHIIRESIDADGVVFFDASISTFNSLGHNVGCHEGSQHTSSEEGSWSSDDAEDECNDTHSDLHIIASSPPQPPSSSKAPSKSKDPLPYQTPSPYKSPETYKDPSSYKYPSSYMEPSPPKTSTKEKEPQPPDRKQMSAKALAALLKRYPKGTIFDFDEHGKSQSTAGYSGRDGQSTPSTPGGTPRLTKKRTASFIGNLGNEVYKSFPGARSVAFVPVWDQIKKRWRAACFAYTYDRTRFFTTKGDISYLRAFATLAMAEMASLETCLTNQAQTDVLASLSHELRSPLHGIILGVEFLTDTPLSVFQGNLLHILETCGRTLADTIDHLLYYAKVNNFIPPGKTPDSRARGLRKEMNSTLQAGMKALTTPVRLDVLMEEVTESIFAGFNFQRLSVGQLERDQRNSHADIYAIRRSDNFQAAEDLGTLFEGSRGVSDNTPIKHVLVDLAIDHLCSHYYHAISGAIRRIVMNLFGNALKYTTSGSIRVSLSQQSLHSKRPRGHNMRWVRIVVTDTGKGISEDFLVNHLFQEFQQENPIAPGLGLGLSVVKKIVSSLKGKVCIESQVGVGTTVTVLLPLQTIPLPYCVTDPYGVEMDDYTEHKMKLRGLRVCFVGFDAPLHLPRHKGNVDDSQSIWNVCRNNLSMQVVSASEAAEVAPDIVLCEEEALYDSFLKREELGKSPYVVVCVNALSAYRLSVDPMFQDASTITEFISQP
ncbi:hypothetical protein F5Y14DRAFT_406928 [Nemania sp. NC0429]|nr:hypothetical protein F5Y14DRAFT_406928 [Nemania sp. NC0429]